MREAAIRSAIDPRRTDCRANLSNYVSKTFASLNSMVKIMSECSKPENPRHVAKLEPRRVAFASRRRRNRDERRHFGPIAARQPHGLCERGIRGADRLLAVRSHWPELPVPAGARYQSSCCRGDPTGSKGRNALYDRPAQLPKGRNGFNEPAPHPTHLRWRWPAHVLCRSAEPGVKR